MTIICTQKLIHIHPCSHNFHNTIWSLHVKIKGLFLLIIWFPTYLPDQFTYLQSARQLSRWGNDQASTTFFNKGPVINHLILEIPNTVCNTDNDFKKLQLYLFHIWVFTCGSLDQQFYQAQTIFSNLSWPILPLHNSKFPHYR